MNSSTIQTKDEFEAAVMADRALLHVDVDWSAYAVNSRPVITKFFESVEKEFGVGYVSFYRVDCTEQSGPIWDITADWFTKNKADSTVMSSGSGAIVWIKKGQLTDSIYDAASKGIADLMTRTRKLFALAIDESATATRRTWSVRSIWQALVAKNRVQSF